MLTLRPLLRRAHVHRDYKEARKVLHGELDRLDGCVAYAQNVEQPKQHLRRSQPSAAGERNEYSVAADVHE